MEYYGLVLIFGFIFMIVHNSKHNKYRDLIAIVGVFNLLFTGVMSYLTVGIIIWVAIWIALIFATFKYEQSK